MRNDRDRHERKDTDQEPIDVPPPFTVPIHIGEIFFRERPPDVNDQKDSNEKPAQQYTAVTGPEFGGSHAEGRHGRHYSRSLVDET